MYISRAVDGVELSESTLPQFDTSTKDQRGNGLSVYLVGLLIHVPISVLRLFTMTHNNSTVTNHVIESVHRVLNDIHRTVSLPRKWFYIIYNCSMENKYRYFMAYMEIVLRWCLFDEVHVTFLPFWNTRNYIELRFSITFFLLRTYDAITIDDMPRTVAQCHNDQTMITSINSWLNWSGICENLSACKRSTTYWHTGFPVQK